MLQGEIFAYPLFLVKELAERTSIAFVCQDVICRFWPWLQKVRPSLPNEPGVQATKDMKPFLSVMHAKAHDWACQVNFIHVYDRIVKVYVVCLEVCGLCNSCDHPRVICLH